MNPADGYNEAKRRIREALDQNATVLHLDGLGLTDLPLELGEITSVKDLSLEYNYFEILPEVVLKLSQLEILYMEHNPLHSLPDRICELQQLQGLNLYECQLNEIPDSIGELINLDHLEFAGNQLRTLPETSGNLTKLEFIGLSRNYLQTLPESFGNLASLELVSLGHNQLNELPESVVQLAKLETMELQRNKLIRLPKSFGKLANLKEINLSDNLIEALPEEMPPLEFLDIRECYQITKLPETLIVTDTLWLGGQKLPFLPTGCKNAKLLWYGAALEERIIIHPETINSHDVISAKDHFAREALFNLMAHNQFLREVHMEKLDEMNYEEDMLTLMKIEIPDSEAETYLITLDKYGKKRKAQWVLPKFRTCQEAFEWLNRIWEED